MLEFVEWIPVAIIALVIFLTFRRQDKKLEGVQQNVSMCIQGNRALLDVKIENLEKKIDELRLQVGIINHGSRVIHMPTVAADIVERRNKDGSIPRKRGRKPKEIE